MKDFRKQVLHLHESCLNGIKIYVVDSIIADFSQKSFVMLLSIIKAVFADLQILASRKRLLYGWSYLFIYLPKRGC